MVWRYALAYRRAAALPEDPPPPADMTEAIEVSERPFRMSQARRRLQMSVMVAILGLGIGAGLQIPPREQPTLYVVTWFVTALAAGYIALLAAADLWSVNRQKARLIRKLGQQQSKLETEYRRAKLASDLAAGREQNDEADPS
jgi:hypothetical protein